MGFSKSPKILAIDMPLNDPQPMSLLSGLLWASLNPSEAMFPRVSLKAQELVEVELGLKSKKVLAEGLHVVPKQLRHRVYAAIRIGQWAFQQTQKVEA